MKKIKFTALLLAFAIIFSFSPSLKICAVSADLDLYSEGIYMVNLDTGVTVYAKNENVRYYPASTTKIMTCIIVMENVPDLDKKVTITYAATDEFWTGDPNKTGASNAALEAGQENITFKDCLYALMLASACEAANILALNTAGSVEAFAALMNAKAAELGCTGTHFSNAHGLWEADNYTTPYDLYLITKYAYDSVPGFMEICDTYSYDFPANTYNPDGYTKYTTNPLITPTSDFYLEYAHGIKTGSIDVYYDSSGNVHDGGRCLVSTASKDGYTYMLVTMQAPFYDSNGQSYNFAAADHVTLYEWALSNFIMQKVVDEGQIAGEIDVEQGEETRLQLLTDFSFSTLLPKSLAENMTSDSSGPLQKKITYKYDSVTAPVTKGEILGTMEVIYQGETISTIDLIAAKSIDRSQFAYIMDRARSVLDTSWFMPLLALLALLLIVQTVLLLIRRRRLVQEAKRKARRR